MKTLCASRSIRLVDGACLMLLLATFLAFPAVTPSFPGYQTAHWDQVRLIISDAIDSYVQEQDYLGSPFDAMEVQRINSLANGATVSQVDFALIRKMSTHMELFGPSATYLLVRDGIVTNPLEALAFFLGRDTEAFPVDVESISGISHFRGRNADDARRILSDFAEPLLLSQFPQSWELFSAAAHSEFLWLRYDFDPISAHEWMMLLVNKFGLDRLPESLILDYFTHVAETNLMRTDFEYNRQNASAFDLSSHSPDELVELILGRYPKGVHLLQEALRRSVGCQSLIDGWPRPLGEYPNPSDRYGIESFEKLFDLLLNANTADERSRITLVTSLLAQANATLAEEEESPSEAELVYTLTRVPISIRKHESVMKLVDLRVNRTIKLRTMLRGGSLGVQQTQE